MWPSTLKSFGDQNATMVIKWFLTHVVRNEDDDMVLEQNVRGDDLHKRDGEGKKIYFLIF